MKKILIALVAVMAIVLTGCKTKTSEVNVYVENAQGEPVMGCPVFYADLASIIISDILPSPEELVTETQDCWEYVKTGTGGIAKININLSVAKMQYEFMVYDAGTYEWKTKVIELQRGKNDEIKFVVSR